ncbi:Isoeugenol synthase 1 [Hibiscus syriacus]|uniref:Isoeugenol synthase 1 n=1 Tax=Hibiscus syriacus TaxID=106335 RepID=A0A6A2ZCT3_HIBSY|nr:Isoeugenol synthase 1 [Hibiscus syriacus]
MSVEKILIFGGTGYLGKYMVKASVSLGHPTFVYTRSLPPNSPASKSLLIKEFESMGVTIFYHEKLVSVLKQVEVVISTIAVPQHLDQLKIISAIKDAGTIKRFVPSEYGNEVYRPLSALPPFEAVLANKRKIRRAVEEAGISFTYCNTPNRCG